MKGYWCKGPNHRQTFAGKCPKCCGDQQIKTAFTWQTKVGKLKLENSSLCLNDTATVGKLLVKIETRTICCCSLPTWVCQLKFANRLSCEGCLADAWQMQPGGGGAGIVVIISVWPLVRSLSITMQPSSRKQVSQMQRILGRIVSYKFVLDWKTILWP